MLRSGEVLKGLRRSVGDAEGTGGENQLLAGRSGTSLGSQGGHRLPGVTTRTCVEIGADTLATPGVTHRGGVCGTFWWGKFALFSSFYAEFALHHTPTMTAQCGVFLRLSKKKSRELGWK